MPQHPIEIDKEAVILTEGSDDKQFLGALLEELELIEKIQLVEAIGKPNIASLLKAIKASSGFRSVRSIAIIRDCDDSAKTAIQATKQAFVNAGLDEPNIPGTLTTGVPSCGFYLLPSPTEPGTIEDLLLKAVAGEELMVCVNEFYGCIKLKSSSQPESDSKLKLHAYIAGTPKASVRGIGTAARAGYLNLQNSVYSPIKEFLQNL